MPSNEDDRVSQEEQGAASSEHSHRLFSWWWVWIPIIVVVILWIGGWTFGNYGGPWSPKPRTEQPQISEPAVTIVNSSNNGAFAA
jgi:heme/copper-type cytochrome/quinol oxidase subunit 2